MNKLTRSLNGFRNVSSNKLFNTNAHLLGAGPSVTKLALLSFNGLKVGPRISFSSNIRSYAFLHSLLGTTNSPLFSGNAPYSINHRSAIQISSVAMCEDTLAVKYPARETKFATPYGQVGALEWGDADAPHKILCVHGWLDNAGSFERLVPFLLNHKDNARLYHIIAMDHPGVGHSSHIPSGAQYTQFTTILEMRRITQQLKWEKVILMGHSLGSHLSFMYSCIYPGQVESMISIDLAHPLAARVNNWNMTLADSIEEYFKYEYNHEDDPVANIRVPVYSEADALERLMVGHSNSLTTRSAEVLLKRGAKKQRWGLTFRRDLRLRLTSLEMKPDDNLMSRMIDGPFRPNLLLIKAKNSPYHRPEELRRLYFEIFSKNCPTFREVILDGTHHLHMNDPELVATEVNKFLDEVRSPASANVTKSNL